LWYVETPTFSKQSDLDGGEVVSLTRRPPFTVMKIPDTLFCYKLGRSQSHSAAESIRSIEKSIPSS
jgi:hypothetical protein